MEELIMDTPLSKLSGRVFIITKKRRGHWADYKSLRNKLGQLDLLDVTLQSKKYREPFSPMKLKLNTFEK